ncbi:MAG TPA: hypothetical protein VN829_05460, partial [Dongiaceae bacterium]|nr:hypothetical protein [Dongiaceae bacterium]
RGRCSTGGATASLSSNDHSGATRRARVRSGVPPCPARAFVFQSLAAGAEWTGIAFAWQRC